LIRSGDIDRRNIPAGIQIIERNARSQARLIDDLLDVSRIIKGNLQLEVHPLNMAPLVETTNEALRPAAEAKDIQVELELDSGACIVSGDPTRLRQVVWNLLMNAIKFTPREGNVHVSLKRISEPDESSVSNSLSGRLATSGLPCVRLTVSDTGEGIKPEFLPYVFHRFRQEESSISRRAGGLGLGLAVVRHLVELHGGTVSARSAGRGRGSTFIVELPVAHERRESGEGGESSPAQERDFVPSATESKVQSLYGVRVLLVEDDDDSRNLLGVMLKRQGAEVIAASSAAEALEALVQSPTSHVQGQFAFSNSQSEIGTLPDIIISDLGMPDKDGFELMRKIRSLASDDSLSTQHSELSTPGSALNTPGSGLSNEPASLSTQDSVLSTTAAQHSVLVAAQSIPAIALTGYATPKDRERALASGYQLHLPKPVEPQQLVAAILSLLGGGSEIRS
jgi:CheY-like chemotaxis protein/two-component sensor histidine kinase